MLCAQSARNDYYSLILEVELRQSYNNFSDDQNSLIDSAKVYAQKDDYEMAMLFLETVLVNTQQNSAVDFVEKEKVKTNTEWQIELTSGIDYNRQEFELGYSLEDSTLLDEVTKPFLGIGINYIYKSLSLNNNFRTDKENITNIFSAAISDNINSMKYRIEGQYLFDNNSLYKELSFNEINNNLHLDYNLKNNWNLYITNLFRYKKYHEPSKTVASFFRNMSALSLSKSYTFAHLLQLSYYLDYNESIDSQNNDFNENNVYLSYKGQIKKTIINLDANYRLMSFRYSITDSLIENKSNTFSVTPSIGYRFEKIYLSVNSIYVKKKYEDKTEQEPDYTQWRIAPEIEYYFSSMFSVSLNYFFEKRKHKTYKGLQNIYIQEQDYQSNGTEIGINYTSLAGFLFSGGVTFSQRKYPNSIDDSAFSLYSDRNILSIFLFSQFPIWKNVSGSLIVLYDNDKDKDSDNNDTQSSFYTFEIKYSF